MWYSFSVSRFLRLKDLSIHRLSGHFPLSGPCPASSDPQFLPSLLARFDLLPSSSSSRLLEATAESRAEIAELERWLRHASAKDGKRVHYDSKVRSLVRDLREHDDRQRAELGPVLDAELAKLDKAKAAHKRLLTAMQTW